MNHPYRHQKLNVTPFFPTRTRCPVETCVTFVPVNYLAVHAIGTAQSGPVNSAPSSVSARSTDHSHDPVTFHCRNCSIRRPIDGPMRTFNRFVSECLFAIAECTRVDRHVEFFINKCQLGLLIFFSWIIWYASQQLGFDGCVLDLIERLWVAEFI